MIRDGDFINPVPFSHLCLLRAGRHLIFVETRLPTDSCHKIPKVPVGARAPFASTTTPPDWHPGRATPRLLVAASHGTNSNKPIEFRGDKATAYDGHPAARAFPDAVLRQLERLDWYNNHNHRSSSSSSSSLRVLDFGCGTGNVAVRLAAAGHRVVAADVSRDMLDRLAAKLSTTTATAAAATNDTANDGPSSSWRRNITLTHLTHHDGNVEPDIGGDSKFDVVLVCFVLHHVSDGRTILGNLSSGPNLLQRPGGRLCLFEFAETERSRRTRSGWMQQNEQDHAHRQHDHEPTHHHPPASRPEDGAANAMKPIDDQERTATTTHSHRHHHGIDWLSPRDAENMMRHGGLELENHQTFEVPVPGGGNGTDGGTADTIMDCYCSVWRN